MFKLPNELSITDVEQLTQRILAYTNENQEQWIFDIGEVIRVDTASVQLMCALKKLALQNDTQLQWHGQSDALDEALACLGLKDYLYGSS